MDALRYLNKALDMEENGYIEEALILIAKIVSAFPEQENDLLLEQAKMKFRNGYEKDALLDFISLYENTKEEELYNLILQAYLEPNQEKLEQQSQRNLKLLEQYPHYCCLEKASGQITLPVWQDGERIIYVNTQTMQFTIINHAEKEFDPAPDTPVVFVNNLWFAEILACEKKCRISNPFMDSNIPMYLTFDPGRWELFIQLYDLELLLKKDRIVFLIGRSSFRHYLMGEMVVFPRRIYAENDSEMDVYYTLLSETIASLEKEEQKNTEILENYYKNNKKEIEVHIKEKTPRILFFTSRFTTALQYHTRDCMEAARRLGCETRLLIECDGIHRVFKREILRHLEQFRPDIIFCLDHFRFEYPAFPEQVVCITWVQDPMPHIMNKSTPAKLSNRDFVMNHFTTWRKFRNIGYDEKLLIDAPVPANAYIYKPYQLSEQELEQYSCDICLVCHASDAEQHVDEIVSKFPKSLSESIRAVYEGYRDYVYETGELFYEEGMFAEYINGAMQQHFSITFNPKTLSFLVNDMYQWYNQRVFRQVLVDWIIDAGFTNLKLWGNGWKSSIKYHKYAMGPATNGETLSKIYQASKIVIGNNTQTTSAARAWETMLSGGFYMSNYIPPESDVTDIRKIIEVGQDVVMFYGKEDLIQKIRYYLTEEEERTKMAERGRKAALEKMTFDILMERVINEVGTRLEGMAHER